MSNQLEDSGAVIGYRPNLEYIKEMNQKTDVSGTNITDISGNITYSDTLTGIINNSPSATISDVKYVIDNIKMLIDDLAEQFNGENWREYNNISTLLNAISIGDNVYIDEFISAHKHDINGSIIPEIIGTLHNTEERMEVLYELLKEIYYGDKHIEQEQMDAIDAANIAKMQAYEEVGEGYKINYVSISYDSILNRAISSEVFGINKKAINMARVIEDSEQITDDTSNKGLIEQLYAEVNDDLDYRQEAFEIQQTVEIMEKTLYNYYNRRNNYVDLYNIYNGQERFSMTHRLYEYQYKLGRSLENVIRSLQGNQYYLSEMTTLEQEKNNLISNYSKLNYKY